MTASLAINPERLDIRPAMLFPATVGFYFSFRLVFVLLSVRLFNADPVLGVGASLIFNFLFLAVAAFHSLGPAPRTVASFLQVPSFRWVLVFLGFSGCSLLWSSAASLSAAFAFWCAMAADVAIVVLLTRVGPADGVSSALMGGYVWGACVISFLAWILPAQSDLRLGDEELLGPNQIGYVCAFAFFVAQYMMRRREGRWAIPAAFLAITMLRSLSKTTIIAFIAGQAILLLWDRSISRSVKIWVSVAAALTFAIFWNLFDAYFDIYSHAGNQAETLTGRIGIWAYILNESIQQPWIGHGFHSVWKVIPPFGAFEARHAHNELLQQFYAYGAVGLCMLVALYGSFYRQVVKIRTASMRTFFFGMLLFILVRGLADTEAFDLSLPLWTIAMIGSTLDREQRTSAVTP